MTIPFPPVAEPTDQLDGSTQGATSAKRRDTSDPIARRDLFLHLLQGSAVIANEATSVETAISSALGYLCHQMDWQVGHAYLPDAFQQFVSSGLWFMDEPDRYHLFRLATESQSLTLETGLAGRALTTRRSLWIPDVTQDASFDRSAVCIDPPLRAGASFPILIDGEVIAILELFSDEVQAADPELLDVLEHVGVQLGLLVERFRVRAALEALNAELERSNRELEEFASIASHDLQEPLRKIQSFGNLLKTRHGQLLPEEGQTYVQRMCDDAARMQQLIDDLLAYSRLAARSQTLSWVDLGALVAAVIDDLGDQIERTRGCVTVGDMPTIVGDPSQLRQVFQNVINNGLKFSRPGTPPIVQITAQRTLATLPAQPRGIGDFAWDILVSDNGIGLEDRYGERIFRMFERLHGRGVYEGTGIGLAICRKIVERHGGSITATGTPGVGSCFTITLPARGQYRGTGL